jgi:hypothetical protein
MSQQLSLRQFLDVHVKIAQRMFEAQKTIAPMFIAETAGGDWAPIITPFTNDAEKDATATALRKTFAELQCVRYAFLAEAWVVTGESYNERMPRPSEHPDRIEAVLVEAADRIQTITADMRIVRGPDDRVRLDKPVYHDMGGTIGRFTGLLDTAH